VIAAPDHWHAAIALDAMKAGKDVYCEKPLTLTIHEAKDADRRTRKLEKVFQTGSQQRSEGPVPHGGEYVRNGRLGKIKQVIVGVGGPSKPCDLPSRRCSRARLGPLAGPGAEAALQLGAQPRGVHTPLPRVAELS
jgi:predicted dehydrogenase